MGDDPLRKTSLAGSSIRLYPLPGVGSDERAIEPAPSPALNPWLAQAQRLRVQSNTPFNPSAARPYHANGSTRPVAPGVPHVVPRPMDLMQVPSAKKQPATTILIADDRAANRTLLRSMLEPEKYIIVEAQDGQAALVALQAITTPVVALVDWEMPGIEEIDVCRRTRLREDAPPMFLFLLIVRDSQRDIVAGLQAGADDYVTKPFVAAELLARVKIGTRMVELQQALANRVAELRDESARVRQLSGVLPIGSY